MTPDAIQAVASRAAALAEFGVSLILARTERVASRALGAVVQLSRSDMAARSALAVIGLMHQGSPKASRVAGQLVGVSVFVAGRGAQMAAQLSRASMAAISRRA